MQNDHAYYVDTNGAVVFDDNVYCSKIITGREYLSTSGKVYAQGGFVFQGQEDAANKLLTANGSYVHIDQLRNAHTTYTLADTHTYILTKPNRYTIQIALEKEYGHYRIDMSALDFSTASQNDICKVVIK